MKIAPVKVKMRTLKKKKIYNGAKVSMKNAKKSSNKNLSYVMRFGMTVLTVILIVLFFSIMIMVGQIQGTARIVNYAGLVRGGTQRMVKLENAGEPQDKMRATIYSYIDGLRNGSDELNFVRLNDKAFQDKMTELDDYFQKLTQEIDLVREKDMRIQISYP